MAKFIKVSELKFNPDNPRIINEAKLEKLKKSLIEFPQMMRLRPIICSSKDDKTVLGGNMRLKSLIDLGYEEIPNEWVLFADELTDKQKKEFIIKDNVSFGDWDLDALDIDWDNDLLQDWGLETEKIEYPDINEGVLGVTEKIELLIKFDNDEDKANMHQYLIEYTGEYKVIK